MLDFASLAKKKKKKNGGDTVGNIEEVLVW